uniref:poly(ADP-ribose) glycohydrolase n=1 Tax=Anopheles epiroticus TaxID=199890 RepID=A0A182PBB0_9DIPT
MALVMLPCDLPWWSNVQKKLAQIEESSSLDVVIDVMQKLHELCNVSLDPDEDGKDTSVFEGLRHFVEHTMDAAERDHFLGHTVKALARHARNLKQHRPPRGLSFSLQQQADSYELSYRLVASLLANAFFSTFPKRTEKTHPTLQDFNFTHFFRGLVELNTVGARYQAEGTSVELTNAVQRAKFRSFLYYFDWLERSGSSLDGTLRVSRKVMTGKQWLTIEDWLECELPLCDVEIRHEGKLDKADAETMQTVFASARLGGDVLAEGDTQESIQFCTFPELLAVLLYVEALEDNESLQVENVHHVARIVDPRQKGPLLERIAEPKTTNVCCIDAENYRALPSQQFEEDDILRELNKCLLAFRQNTSCSAVLGEPNGPTAKTGDKRTAGPGLKLDQLETVSSKGRLSPIGERDREGSTPGSPDVYTTIFIRQATPNSKRSSSDSNKLEKDINKRRSWLSPERPTAHSSVCSGTGSNRRGKFIILGSSGECLPVNRHPLRIPDGTAQQQLGLTRPDTLSSCGSSQDEFHSAKDSFDEDDEDGLRAHAYTSELDTPERRYEFAQKLRAALVQDRTNGLSGSTDDSSYAVGISVAGSQIRDQDIRVKRGGSCGFVLDGSIDSNYDELEWNGPQQQEKVPGGGPKQNGTLERKGTNESSKYSFDSDLGSELEEVYEKFAKWLEEPISTDKPKKLDARDEAVLKFANSLLKRTLSESFVGIPFTEECLTSGNASVTSSNASRTAAGRAGTGSLDQKEKILLHVRSLSLELAKHKHRLAAQLRNDYLALEPAKLFKCPNIQLTRTDHRKLLHKLRSTQSGSGCCSVAEVTVSPPVPAIHPAPPQPRLERQSSLKTKLLQYKPNWSVSYTQDIKCDDVVLKISQLAQKRTFNVNLRPVATGNWGCGSSKRGDVQLKMVIQWMAASVAGLPYLTYYTAGNEKLSKLDTICRVLKDRKWTVGELAAATLSHARDILEDPFYYNNDRNYCMFFEKLIGLEKAH